MKRGLDDVKTYEEYDIICLPSKDYSRLVLHKGRDLHQRRYYGTAWTDMGDTYAELYVLSNEEIDIHKGRPCGQACFAHKTKPCDKCGRYQGRTVVASTHTSPLIPDSYLDEYVSVANSNFFSIKNTDNYIKKITLQTRLYGVPEKDDEYAIVKPKVDPNCYKHQKTVLAYPGSLDNLAIDIGNLHYESLAEFLHLLSKKLHSDAKKDHERGRTNLADSLFESAVNTYKASSNINDAWKISKRFMK